MTRSVCGKYVFVLERAPSGFRVVLTDATDSQHELFLDFPVECKWYLVDDFTMCALVNKKMSYVHQFSWKRGSETWVGNKEQQSAVFRNKSIVEIFWLQSTRRLFCKTEADSLVTDSWGNLGVSRHLVEMKDRDAIVLMEENNVVKLFDYHSGRLLHTIKLLPPLHLESMRMTPDGIKLNIYERMEMMWSHDTGALVLSTMQADKQVTATQKMEFSLPRVGDQPGVAFLPVVVPLWKSQVVKHAKVYLERRLPTDVVNQIAMCAGVIDCDFNLTLTLRGPNTEISWIKT